jgi:hypothetical protein
MRTTPFRIAAFALALVAARGACAEEDPAAAARAAGAQVRASLPDPKDAGPFLFEGDLVIAGEAAGSVRYAAEPAVHEGQRVWEVAEDVAQTFGGSKARSGTTLTLTRDLTLLEGEITRRTADDFLRLKFQRTADGFSVERTVSSAEKEPTTTTTTVAAPANATYGRTALALFLRGAPKKASARYVLPWFSPEAATRKPGDHDPTPDAEMRLQVQGGATFAPIGDGCPSWAATAESGGRAWELHFTPEDRKLLGVVGRVPPVHVVPLGKAPPATRTDMEAPATSWRAAFLKFGRGYHMGVEEWLDAAFHWPSFHAHESSLEGGWPKEKPVEEFRTAWLAEFMKSSPRRTRSGADELLSMTLATGNVTEETSDKVVFAAHPEFGGGVQRTYPSRKIDDVWRLTRIDEKR